MSRSKESFILGKRNRQNYYICISYAYNSPDSFKPSEVGRICASGKNGSSVVGFCPLPPLIVSTPQVAQVLYTKNITGSWRGTLNRNLFCLL